MDISILELTKKYRNGSLTPLDYIQLQLKKVYSIDPRINPIATLFDRKLILKQAKESTLRYTNKKPLGPFDGVPITIKADYKIKGIKPYYGSQILQLNSNIIETPPKSESFVKMMEEYGAIPLCRTTIPEMMWKASTSSLYYGITRNPHNLMLTAGGSSGGAAALCALNIGHLHFGSDGGGSVRIPSACCGVIGFKPSLSISKCYDEDEFPYIGHNGPISRYLDDIILFMRQLSVYKNILTNLDWNDTFIKNADISGLKIAVSKDLDGIVDFVDNRIWKHILNVIQYLKSIGADIEYIDPPLSSTKMNYYDTLIKFWGMVMVKYCKIFDEYNDGNNKYMVDPGLLELIERGKNMTVDDMINITDSRDEIREIMNIFHDKYDILITPTLPIIATEALDYRQDWKIKDCKDSKIKHFIDCYHSLAAFTCLFNLTNQPAITMNVGYIKDEKYNMGNIPIGVQIAGKVDHDNVVLKIAYNLEKRFKTMTVTSKL